ncbi:efflux pump antibiotic resistance protein [Lipomyces japonicus]|uniref:efflux pump antibiotic resistance protein n=1 Tax=Lipomyces japonicus TaxID=56871 RepID=UPI0034CF1D70
MNNQDGSAELSEKDLNSQSTGLTDEQKINEISIEDANEHVYLEKWALVATTTALYLAVFLVALDRTIIATALPRITDDFHSIEDIGWYGSSYLLTSCSFLLTFGRFYTFYCPKWVFLIAIGLFEIGSAICGAAPSSTSFIVGRAIAGLGSCGIFSGAIVIITDSVPLQKRPMYTGFVGAMFGIASVVAPLMGGAFTERVSWRWCFYINLPIGAVAVAIIFFILKALPPPNPSPAKSLRDRLGQLDFFGILCLFPSIICLLLALQWGGSKYSWANARIIVLFILFGLLFVGFVAVQIWKKETATVPLRIIKNRSIVAGILYTFCVGGVMMIYIYYLPIWFQAIKGVSSIKSGIMSLPLVLSLSTASILAGILVSRIGYYTPFMYIGTFFISIGAGLIITFKPTTMHAKWIGFQFIFGFGLGLGMQQSNVAAQTVLERKDVPTGASLMMFSQTLGGAIFLSIAETVFTNNLIKYLQRAIPGHNNDSIIELISNTGATDLRYVVASNYLPQVLSAYNDALRQTFIVGLCLSCMTCFGAFSMKWQSVKSQKQSKTANNAAKSSEDGDANKNFAEV